MTDNTQQPGAAETPETEVSEVQSVAALPAWAQKELADARKEAAKNRVARKQAEDAANAAAETSLAEQNKWKELAEKRQRDLDGLKPVQERVTSLETAFTTALQKRLEAIPEEYKTLVPEFDDPVKTWNWLDANSQLFARRTAPRLDGGAQGDAAATKNTRKLTELEVQTAKNAGMTADQYLAQLLKSEARGTAAPLARERAP